MAESIPFITRVRDFLTRIPRPIRIGAAGLFGIGGIAQPAVATPPNAGLQKARTEYAIDAEKEGILDRTVRFARDGELETYGSKKQTTVNAERNYETAIRNLDRHVPGLIDANLRSKSDVLLLQAQLLDNDRSSTPRQKYSDFMPHIQRAEAHRKDGRHDTAEKAARDAMADLLNDLEGSKNRAYTDITGHRTIGKGFNMDVQGARQIWADAFNDPDYKATMGKKHWRMPSFDSCYRDGYLTRNEIRQLTAHVLKDKIKRMEYVLQKFHSIDVDALPMSARVALWMTHYHRESHVFVNNKAANLRAPIKKALTVLMAPGAHGKTKTDAACRALGDNYVDLISKRQDAHKLLPRALFVKAIAAENPDVSLTGAQIRNAINATYNTESMDGHAVVVLGKSPIDPNNPNLGISNFKSSKPFDVYLNPTAQSVTKLYVHSPDGAGIEVDRYRVSNNAAHFEGDHAIGSPASRQGRSPEIHTSETEPVSLAVEQESAPSRSPAVQPSYGSGKFATSADAYVERFAALVEAQIGKGTTADRNKWLRADSTSHFSRTGAAAGSGANYCAGFVNYYLREAVPGLVGDKSNAPLQYTVGAKAVRNQLQDKGYYHTDGPGGAYKVKRGDLVIFQRGTGWTGHIGVVVDVEAREVGGKTYPAAVIKTVEANRTARVGQFTIGRFANKKIIGFIDTKALIHDAIENGHVRVRTAGYGQTKTVEAEKIFVSRTSKGKVSEARHQGKATRIKAKSKTAVYAMAITRSASRRG